MAAQRVSTGYEPNKYQRAIHEALKRFSVIVAHRRFGKTVLSINSLIDAALRCQLQSGRFAYIAPLRVQAKAVVWDYLKRYASPIPGVIINEGELWVEFPNGARVRLYGADNPDAMRGLYFDGVVLDEVAQMKPEVWGEIIRPALTDRKGWAVFIGTPKGINLFSKLYFDGLQDPDWYCAMYRVDETDVLSKEEVELARKTMGDSEYRREMLCDFNASGDDVLIPVDVAVRAAGKHLREDQYSFAARVLGVDVARYGNDRSVIFPRQGLAAFKPVVMTGLNNMDLAGRVAAAIDRFKPDAVNIDAGRGEGVIDRLRQLGFTVNEVQFGGRPTNPRFANKRSEMWFEMAEWLTSGGAIPNMPELKTDLCVPTYSYANAAGKFELESKDKIRERGMPSPDIGDALALTFAYSVMPRTDAYGRDLTVGHAVRDHDPYAAAQA